MQTIVEPLKSEQNHYANVDDAIIVFRILIQLTASPQSTGSIMNLYMKKKKNKNIQREYKILCIQQCTGPAVRGFIQFP